MYDAHRLYRVIWIKLKHYCAMGLENARDIIDQSPDLRQAIGSTIERNPRLRLQFGIFHNLSRGEIRQVRQDEFDWVRYRLEQIASDEFHPVFEAET